MNTTNSVAALLLLIITAFVCLYQNADKSRYGFEEWKMKYGKVYQ